MDVIWCELITSRDHSHLSNAVSMPESVPDLPHCRGLDFIHAMFKELLADQKNGVTDENFTPTVNRAYESSLKQYHGWMTQKVIGVRNF
ncbi:hypothetical protein BaRGS_00034415 [Batillaria attramentaria]|uniref:Glycolipid transfer protein domain-containing protein n=1 Tax=Batillaria attramentaria TaxID=370345 RepID=A0ABD0JHA7_9CAEN